jgi:2-succinyl-5-enolpyruvyl-6-hydroxy-3-cyclohexene-1-carboxylate synthase
VIDERSAAFFALGIGKESATPAALVCTSGTAGANFYPAVVEGAMSRLPLVVLTADRPHELQGWGALQTIPQHRLYGEFTRWFADLGLPEPRLEALAHLRATICRAVAVATQLPRGIVQINVPFREPLAPTPEPFHLQGGAGMPDERRPGIRLAAPERIPSKEALAQLRERIRQHPRGLIVCGPKDASGEEVEAVASLGRTLGYPILAECDSQLRFGRAGADVISLYDGLLSHGPFACAHRPDVVLRFGGALISKRLMAWLDGSGAFTAVFTDDGACADPNHTAALVVEGSVTSSCRFLAESLPPRQEEWFHSFAAAERKARAALEAAFSRNDALTEPRIAREAVSALSPGCNLVVSSSMPIRDLDAFTPGSKVALRVFANRGANGIEGMASTALGISAASGRPTLLLAGDLAFVHDLGGLLTARRHRISLTALVVNNDGGGIFSFLPIAQFPDHFEELFATPHGLDFSSVAQLFQAHFVRPRNSAELRSGLKECLEGGLHIIDARTDRSANPAEHQKLFEQIGAALDGGSS